MTGAELSKLIGRAATITLPVNKDLLRLPVIVTDCRSCFGRIDYQIEYLQQRVWVSSYQIKISEEVSKS